MRSKSPVGIPSPCLRFQSLTRFAFGVSLFSLLPLPPLRCVVRHGFGRIASNLASLAQHAFVSTNTSSWFGRSALSLN